MKKGGVCSYYSRKGQGFPDLQVAEDFLAVTVL
jgi:hypothetical protein